MASGSRARRRLDGSRHSRLVATPLLPGTFWGSINPSNNDRDRRRWQFVHCSCPRRESTFEHWPIGIGIATLFRRMPLILRAPESAHIHRTGEEALHTILGIMKSNVHLVRIFLITIHQHE